MSRAEKILRQKTQAGVRVKKSHWDWYGDRLSSKRFESERLVLRRLLSPLVLSGHLAYVWDARLFFGFS